MNWDGSDVIADNGITTSYTIIPNVGIANVYGTGAHVFAAKGDSDKLGFVSLSLGDVYETYGCSQGENVLLAQIRFAFRAGKNVADLNAGSIRCMNVSELNATAQSSAILLNTDEDNDFSYEYLRQSNNTAIGGDRINAPLIVYPGSEISVGVHGELPLSIKEASEPTAPNESAGQDATVSPELSSVGTKSAEAPIAIEALTPVESTFSNEIFNSAGFYVSNGSASPDGTIDVNNPVSISTWLYMVLISVTIFVILFVVLLLRKSKRIVLPVLDSNKSNRDG